MPNFSPKTEQLKSFQPVGETEGKLSRKPLQFVVEQEIHDVLAALPKEQRISLLRKWVREGVQSLQES